MNFRRLFITMSGWFAFVCVVSFYFVERGNAERQEFYESMGCQE